MNNVADNSDLFDFRLTESGLQIHSRNGGADALLPWLWLRDHCQAEHSFNHETGQRRQTPPELDFGIAAVGLQWLSDTNELTVQWNNDEPPGRYPAEFFSRIADNSGAIGEKFIEPKLWDAAALADGTPTAEFREIADGGTEWLMKLAEYGFVLINSAPPDKDGVKAIASAIGHVRETIYGGLWTLESGSSTHQDTAYSSEALGAHTDSTYSHDAPGLQMLLCSELDSKGGESTLADGFRIAEIMREEDPDLYAFLRALPVPGEYLEKNVHLRACRPMFDHDSETGRLAQVSYNCYDRAPFLLSPEDGERFYRGVRRFHELANSPTLAWEHKLEPGMALLFDNWRLLHGRRAFSGFRKFCGCYLDRETLQSKLRVTFGLTL
ncbi:MAG: TauD/TfdA family dioxygenase [Gammaproteobacteria bacterium WSBS_2016_MAG_OTU1]